MFTKKHFEKVADIIGNSRPGPDVHAGDNPMEKLREQIAEAFVQEFAASNPNFDRDKFMQACGFE